jgi:hypothetical protein
VRPSTPGAADTTERALAYTVTFRGLDVAEISGAARETDSAYAAAVQIRSTGLAAAFARVRFDMQVEGFRAGDTLSPYHYRAAVDTGQRHGAVELLWPAGEGPVLLSDPPDVEAGVERVSAAEAAGAQRPPDASSGVSPDRSPDPPCAIGGPRSSTARVWPPSRWEGRR